MNDNNIESNETATANAENVQNTNTDVLNNDFNNESTSVTNNKTDGHRRRSKRLGTIRRRTIKQNHLEILPGHSDYILLEQLRAGLASVYQNQIKTKRKPLPSSNIEDNHYIQRSVFDVNSSEMEPFRIVVFAPHVFASLRASLGWSETDFFRSVAPSPLLYIKSSSPSTSKNNHNSFIEKKPYLKFLSNSRGGQLFFETNDRCFMFKTEAYHYVNLFMEFLRSYVEYTLNYPHSLLVKILGVYAIRSSSTGTTHIYIMQSVFYPDQNVTLRYDLKGCYAGRFEKPSKRKTYERTLKDRNFENGQLRLGSDRPWFLHQLARDLHFLENLGIVDYSLLVGQQLKSDLSHHNVLIHKASSEIQDSSQHTDSENTSSDALTQYTETKSTLPVAVAQYPESNNSLSVGATQYPDSKSTPSIRVIESHKSNYEVPSTCNKIDESVISGLDEEIKYDDNSKNLLNYDDSDDDEDDYIDGLHPDESISVSALMATRRHFTGGRMYSFMSSLSRFSSLSNSLSSSTGSSFSRSRSVNDSGQLTSTYELWQTDGMIDHHRHLRQYPRNAVHVFNGTDYRYYIGVIDIFTKYELRQRLTRRVKDVKFMFGDHSTVPPHRYAERLFNFVEKRTFGERKEEQYHLPPKHTPKGKDEQYLLPKNAPKVDTKQSTKRSPTQNTKRNSKHLITLHSKHSSNLYY